MGERGHVPALDGLRGVAILLVIAGHVTGWDAAAHVGVTVFFVLSGYLITGVLLRPGLHLPSFYARRAARLLPALFVMAAVVWAYGQAIGFPMWRVVLPGLLYVQNFVSAADANPNGSFAHTWSLALEEQFYLLWPLAVVFARRRLGHVAVCIAAVAVVLRLVTWVALGGQAAYFLPVTSCAPILAGCAVAVLGNRWRLGWPLLALCVLAPPSDPEAVLVPIAATLATLPLLTSRGLLEHPALRWFGDRSYGWYLWHWPWLMLPPAGLLPGWSAIVAAGSLGVACASRRYVERPVQRWARRRLRATPAVAAIRQEPAAHHAATRAADGS